MSADSNVQCTTLNKKIFPKTSSAPPEKHSSSDKTYFDRANSPPPSYEIACQLKESNCEVLSPAPDDSPCSSRICDVYNNQSNSKEALTTKPLNPQNRRLSLENNGGESSLVSPFSQSSSDRTQSLFTPHCAPNIPRSYFDNLAEVETGIIPQSLYRQLPAVLSMYYSLKHNYSSSEGFPYKIWKVTTCCVWSYRLQTITEHRFISSIKRPYTGSDDVTKSSVFEQRSVWDYDIVVPSAPLVPAVPFTTWSKKFELMDKTTISACDSCSGHGAVRCSWCRGEGSSACKRCAEYGPSQVIESGRKHNYFNPLQRHVRNEACYKCDGTTTSRCRICHGNGVVACTYCKGYGKMETKYYVNAKWKGKVSKCWNNDTIFQLNSLKGCKEIIAYEKSKEWETLSPITANECNHKTIIKASQKMLACHKYETGTQFVRHQSHRTAVTPVFQVSCYRGLKEKRFWIAGANLKVIAYDRSSAQCNIL